MRKGKTECIQPYFPNVFINRVMKKKLQLLLIVMILTATAQAQVLRPFASRYYNPSVRGNIVYVSNSIVSTAGIGAGSPGTGEVPPTGTTRNNAGAGINIDVDNPAPTVKLPFGSIWNYQAGSYLESHQNKFSAFMADDKRCLVCQKLE